MIIIITIIIMYLIIIDIISNYVINITIIVKCLINTGRVLLHLAGGSLLVGTVHRQHSYHLVQLQETARCWGIN